MIWTPHATVAVVVEKDGRYLLVKEHSNGDIVYNQPAGHVEEDESIFSAAIRETLEESGWEVELKSIIGLYTYKAPSNGVTYYRICFEAIAIKKVSDTLDSDIISEHWYRYDEICQLNSQLRSTLVKTCIDDFRNNKRYPLSFIDESAFKP
ncbi:NUDIX hydrolase [Alkalimarinus alittae]|uniref:Phosphatase NudJ n=1 Tax=Alkalimarinus alittae TaxID=2961619 RepID=A0ABY6N728_9ALTE|nr:NUDIX hydrolase [Alkalimarinus alittae]UZE97933.1 NUDIX hydrolase [Alkalimarinus alittae]